MMPLPLSMLMFYMDIYYSHGSYDFYLFVCLLVLFYFLNHNNVLVTQVFMFVFMETFGYASSLQVHTQLSVF